MEKQSQARDDMSVYQCGICKAESYDPQMCCGYPMGVKGEQGVTIDECRPTFVEAVSDLFGCGIRI